MFFSKNHPAASKLRAPSRRAFVKLLAGAGALAAFDWPERQAFTEVLKGEDEYFIFIHAGGGWDVTLWADPRNEKKGIIQPAASDNQDFSQVRRYVEAPLDEGVRTFQLVRPQGSNITFGPGIGEMGDHYDRICLVNGLAMNTVSHPDGTAYSATGRHLIGGRSPASSVDTMMANEFGKEQTFPVVSVQFPSFYVGDNLDRRVVPLAVGQIGSISRTLTRSKAYDADDERDLVTNLLAEEAHDLAAKSAYPDAMQGMGLQYEGLRKMLSSNLADVFSADALRKSQPQFNYKSRQGGAAVNAAFAIEAMKRNVVRCVSFMMGGFDTHGVNYKTHALLQQDSFDMVATLLKTLDATPHPTRQGKKLADHTHILVVSEFCRTPQINAGMGRDHYPNNSAMVISPRFRSNFVFGKADPEQLLPMPAKQFKDGNRAVTPADLLCTFLRAFSVEPRKYLRDGEVVPELLNA